MPAAAKEHTQEGAVAFAKYYWNEGGEALKSGDTSLLHDLSSKDCDVCHAYIDSIDADTAKGLHANINPSQIGASKVTDETEGKSDQVVTLEVTDRTYRQVNKEGEAVAQADAVDYDILIYVDWVDARWSVVDTFMFTK